MKSKKRQFLNGLSDGVPIALGYLSVSFAFGISAVNSGLSCLEAVAISATNLTSAGQLAGVEIIAACGTLLEIALTQLIINLRYMLMSLSLSQKKDESFTLLDRLVLSFGITDEIFAVASLKHRIYPSYMYGLILMPFIGWTAGTFLGGYSGEMLPENIKSALGVAIYGMFIAIIVPPAKKDKGALLAIISSVAISLSFYYIPFFDFITEGFSIILCAVIASIIAAVIMPIKEDKK